MMPEKRMNSKLKGVHGGVSTDGLSLLARIIATYHLNQLRAEQTVHPAVPRGQAGGQAGGQVDGQEDGH